jgi:predicted membrane channel-forming protein YqfA (hemolysin III family)
LLLRSKFETRGLVLYVVLGAIVVTFTHAVKEGFPGGEALLWEFQKSGACLACPHQQALGVAETRCFGDAAYAACAEQCAARLAGSCYLLGLIFYLDDTVPFSNALWHACVLSGAVSHWVIMYRLIAAGDTHYPLP